MNYKGIARMLGTIFLIEAAFMLPAACLGMYDGDQKVWQSFLVAVGCLVVLGSLLSVCFRKQRRSIYAREGFMLVGSVWIFVSLFGALPFFLSGEIPNFLDAFYETVSGFTGTGSTILDDVDRMSRGLLLWRSFTNWLGGMGIVVFMLALMPTRRGKGETLYVLQAESAGPSIEKTVPKIRNHAALLYGIYMGLSLACFLLLFLGGMPLFDSLCITFGTAGTGGFAIKGDSLLSYSAYHQVVVTVFLMLFGINFNLYALILLRKAKNIWRDEELRVYLGVMAAGVLLITVNVANQFSSVGEAVRHVTLSVASVTSTAGFTTVDFSVWPEFSKGILLLLMLMGGCAGSTSCGLKVSRCIILLKGGYREVRRQLQPQSVALVRLNGRAMPDGTISGVFIYFAIYMMVLLLSIFLISLDNFSLETNASAVVASLNNIGPGMGMVGPKGNFGAFSLLSKLVLIVDMLFGRLEIFPVLLLFHYKTWRKAA